jgi:hypothetical protein
LEDEEAADVSFLCPRPHATAWAMGDVEPLRSGVGGAGSAGYRACAEGSRSDLARISGWLTRAILQPEAKLAATLELGLMQCGCGRWMLVESDCERLELFFAMTVKGPCGVP